MAAQAIAHQENHAIPGFSRQRRVLVEAALWQSFKTGIVARCPAERELKLHHVAAPGTPLALGEVSLVALGGTT